MRDLELPRPRAVMTLARVVFRELVRDKVLYNGVLAAVLLLFLMFFVSQLTIGSPERVVTSFGLVIARIGMVGIGTLLAASLVPKEFARRTALVVLSRPVSRLEWTAGMYAGVACVLAVNWVILSASLLATLALVGGSGGSLLHVALGMTLAEGLVVAAVAFLFSSFSTPALSVTLTIGVLLVGSNVSQIRFLQAGSEGIVSAALGFFASAVPALERFQLAENVVYSIPVGGAFVAGLLAYAAFWILLLVGASALIITRKRA